jgi:hypothetical protein
MQTKVALVSILRNLTVCLGFQLCLELRLRWFLVCLFQTIQGPATMTIAELIEMLMQCPHLDPGI